MRWCGGILEAECFGLSNARSNQEEIFWTFDTGFGADPVVDGRAGAGLFFLLIVGFGERRGWRPAFRVFSVAVFYTETIQNSSGAG